LLKVTMIYQLTCTTTQPVMQDSTIYCCSKTSLASRLKHKY